MARVTRALVLFLSLLLLAPLAATANVQALFDLSSPGGGPFPSDRFTVADDAQLTGLRVALPLPDCATRPSDCADLAVVNTLDGFNVQPRLSIPFSGAIDPATLTSANIFLVSLGDTVTGAGAGKVVGINQAVWDPATRTAHAESDELLDQHTRYALIVTNGVRDAFGARVGAGDFATFRRDLNFGHTKDAALKAYRKSLLSAVALASVPPARVVAASVFTTQSATAVLEKIRDQIKATVPAPASLNLGPGGAPTVFPVGTFTGVTFNREISVGGALSPAPAPVAALGIFPGSVGAIAFGTYVSPDYETAQKFIPPVGTRTGTPQAQNPAVDVYFNLILPAGTPPASGWPVAIYGHGFTDNKNNSLYVLGSTLAHHGVATIAINVVGHGGGAAGTLTVDTLAGPVTFPAGGRGIDQDGNGTIDSTEGVNATPPQTIISNRDGLRQTVIDLMQLTRVIETGGIPGLDPSRIYYVGQSFGGIYGTIFLAVEPSVRAGVPNVPGGSIPEIARLSPDFRPLVTLSLLTRVPSLLNVAPIVPPLFGFNENIPLRDVAPLTNTVAGAMAIQEFLDNTEWVSQSGNPVAYAPHIRKDPLGGMTAKSVIVQFAKGDPIVPNPTASALIRAGALEDRATYFRNDLLVAAVATANAGLPVPAVAVLVDLLDDPHTFLTNIVVPYGGPFAVAAQAQIAVFFETDGAVVLDPGPIGPIDPGPITILVPQPPPLPAVPLTFDPQPIAALAAFEVPIAGALPETLNFVP